MTDQRTMGHRIYPFTSDSFFSTIFIVVGTIDNDTRFSLEGKPLNTKHVCIHLDRDLHPKLTYYHIYFFLYK